MRKELNYKLPCTRRFSEEFKRARVKEYELGKLTARQICRKYLVSKATIYRWINRYSIYSASNIVVVEMKDSQESKIEKLEKQVKELELLLGRKEVKLDYLEKLIEVASNDLGIDLKKNTSSKP